MASSVFCVLLLDILAFTSWGSAKLMFTGGTFSANDGYIYSASINQNYNANKTILKANCTDSSGNTDVVYTLIYADEQFFTINSSSGIVSLAVDGWEFPHDGIYIALINCQLERRLPPVRATLQVTFKTQNYFTPVFRHPNLFEFTFPEDYNISQNRELVTLNATDGDKGDCGRIIYSIATGNSRNTFEITQSSGVVSFARSLDWEITSEYNLQVTAGPVDMTRCSYPSLPSAVATIRVFVNDTNDTPPEFDSDLYTVSIQENTKPQEFLQVHCSDPDSSSYIIYLIENIHLFHFNINGINGNLSITNPLDYEQQDSYLLNIACRDTQVLSFDQVDYTLVNITVLPMNEYRPDIVNQGVKNAVIYDDTPVGTLLFSPWPRQDINPPLWLRVEDRDQGLDHSKLTFVLTSIDELARNRIILTQTSGEIILVEEFEKSCYQNFSGQNFRIVNFHLTVCDIANLSSCPTFSLTLYVVQSKCVTMFPQNYTRLYINESAPIGTVIKSIQCIGHEANSNKTLSILHSQDPEIGKTFALSTDGSYIFLKKSLDYEERKHYNIFLLCVNAYGSKAIAELEVVVLPENDNPPYFDKPLYIFNITSLSFSLPIVAGKIQARDMDSDFGVNLTYFLNSSSKYFSVDINGTLLIYAMPPKFRKQYIFEVRASDGKFTAETVVLILLPNDFTDQTCTVTVASDVNTSSVMGLTAIVVFMGVLISLMLVLITFLCVKIKRRPKPEPKTTQIRDYNEDACLAYNVTSLSSAAATNNTYYSEIKCKEGDKTEYSQMAQCEPHIPAPQPYARPCCTLPRDHVPTVSKACAEEYIQMKTATESEADKLKGEHPQESSVEFGGIIRSGSHMTPQTFGEEPIEERKGEREEDANGFSTLEYQSPRIYMMDNIYEHIQ